MKNIVVGFVKPAVVGAVFTATVVVAAIDLAARTAVIPRTVITVAKWMLL